MASPSLWGPTGRAEARPMTGFATNGAALRAEGGIVNTIA
jgi:hypothetical protein